MASPSIGVNTWLQMSPDHLQGKFSSKCHILMNSRKSRSAGEEETVMPQETENLPHPTPAYQNSSTRRPKLCSDKYNDLMELIDGKHPLITHPDHVQFYKNLTHA